MVLKTGNHPAMLKDDVCSPGGSTITAVDQLEQSGIRGSMMKAVEAAAKKCHQLGSWNEKKFFRIYQNYLSKNIYIYCRALSEKKKDFIVSGSSSIIKFWNKEYSMYLYIS